MCDCVQSKEEELPGVEVVKTVKEDFQTDWATAADVAIPQAEVADVSSSLVIILQPSLHCVHK